MAQRSVNIVADRLGKCCTHATIIPNLWWASGSLKPASVSASTAQPSHMNPFCAPSLWRSLLCECALLPVATNDAGNEARSRTLPDRCIGHRRGSATTTTWTGRRYTTPTHQGGVCDNAPNVLPVDGQCCSGHPMQSSKHVAVEGEAQQWGHYTCRASPRIATEGTPMLGVGLRSDNIGNCRRPYGLGDQRPHSCRQPHGRTTIKLCIPHARQTRMRSLGRRQERYAHLDWRVGMRPRLSGDTHGLRRLAHRMAWCTDASLS